MRFLEYWKRFATRSLKARGSQSIAAAPAAVLGCIGLVILQAP